MKTGIFWVTALQIMITLGVLLTGACTPPVQYPTFPTDNRNRDDNRGSRDNRNRDDRNRDREIDKRERTGECAENRQCQEICDDIFKSRKDREECEEFGIDDVEAIEDIFNVLDDPDEDDLADMDLADLDFMLGISISPLEDAVDDMSPSERKDFLAWLAGDSEAADIIADSEDEFEILKELFGSTDVVASLNKSVDGGDSFVEIALEEGNDVALEWLHDWFGEKCDSKDNDYEPCIFRDYYCKFSLSSDYEEEYFDHEFFEDMLDSVLDTEQNVSHTDDTWGGSSAFGEWPEGTEASDLDKWKNSPHNVCGEIEPDADYNDEVNGDN